MSLESVIAFWRKVQNDTTLQQNLDPAHGLVPSPTATNEAAQLAALERIAKKAGFDCTAEEFRVAEAVTRFWNEVHTSAALQEALIPAEEMARDEAGKFVAAVAKRSGFVFDAAQLDYVTNVQVQASGRRMNSGELSEKHLESVAGGVTKVAAYDYSTLTAVSGGYTNIADRIGPGLIAAYEAGH